MPLSVIKLEQLASERDGTFRRTRDTKLIKSARAEAINILKQDDDQVLLCAEALRNRQFAQSSAPATNKKKTDTDDAPWPATYTQHWRVGKQWLASWMLQQKSPLAPQILVDIDTHDPEDGIRRLLEFLTGVKKNDHFPKALQCKTVAGRFYTKRYRDLGCRLDKLVQAGAFQTDGGVAYEVYRLVPLEQDPRQTGKVVHIQGAEVELAEGQRFPITAAICNNHNDLDACIHHGIIKFNLHELFDDEVLKKTSFSKQSLADLAAKLESQREKQAEQVTAGTVVAEKEVEIINPTKRKQAKLKDAREQKKVALMTPSGTPAPMKLAVAGAAKQEDESKQE